MDSNFQTDETDERVDNVLDKTAPLDDIGLINENDTEQSLDIEQMPAEHDIKVRSIKVWSILNKLI